MKRSLLPIFLLLSVNLLSQDTSFVKFGAELNPKIITNIFEKSEDAETYFPLSGSIAGNIYLKLNQKLSLQSGLSFSVLKVGQKDYSLIFGCDIDPSTGIDIENSWRNTKHANYYLGIPIAIKWNLSNKANTPYLKIGQETLFRLGKKSTDEIVECGNSGSPSTVPSTYEFSDFVIAFDFGIGYEFILSKNIKFYLEPNIEYSANPFLQNDILPPTGFNELNQHFFNIGLNMGLMF
jgi:outer membrane protein with beta-barrel domain